MPKPSGKSTNPIQLILECVRSDNEYNAIVVIRGASKLTTFHSRHKKSSLFLVEQLRKEGKLPPMGGLATPLSSATVGEGEEEPSLLLSTGQTVPRLAFGLYKVPPNEEGEAIIANAIKAGYRHFDKASYYGNEVTLGNALRKSGLPRSEFFVSSKVWNDDVKEGRQAVRQSFEQSLSNLNFGDYFDLFYVHWPVPDHYIGAYCELQNLSKEGKIRSIGLSNFTVDEYEELVKHADISIPPAVNQFEVSPFMYRPKLIQYFQGRGIAVVSSKALNRAACLDQVSIADIARRYSVTPAQVLLRWNFQKGLIVATKTSSLRRMEENRSILHFELSSEDMAVLDSLTTEKDIREREELEAVRKISL